MRYLTARPTTPNNTDTPTRRSALLGWRGFSQQQRHDQADGEGDGSQVQDVLDAVVLRDVAGDHRATPPPKISPMAMPEAVDISVVAPTRRRWARQSGRSS